MQSGIYLRREEEFQRMLLHDVAVRAHPPSAKEAVAEHGVGKQEEQYRHTHDQKERSDSKWGSSTLRIPRLQSNRHLDRLMGANPAPI